MITCTTKLKEWLLKTDQVLLTYVIPGGCSGYKIDYILKPYSLFTPRIMPRHFHSTNMSDMILDAKIDYVSEPLFEGIKIDYTGDEVCGCGASSR